MFEVNSKKTPQRHLFKVNNKNTKNDVNYVVLVFLSLTLNRRCSGIFIGNFGYILHLFLMFLSLNK